VVERLSRSSGGVEQVVWQVARGLAEAGESVHVFCRRSDDAPPGVVVVPIRVSAAWQPWRVVAFSHRVTRAIAQTSPGLDLVQSFTRTAHQDIYRAGAGRHADFMRHTHGALGAGLRSLSPRHRIALRADRRIFDDPDQWIQCPSALVRDEIVRGAGIDPARTVVIANGVDPVVFHDRPDEASRSLRNRFAARGDTVWLFAGSGAKRKGLDVALGALARARVGRPVLWVAGRDAPGPWQRLARRAGVADRVRFLGHRDDMPDLHRAADGLLLPTRYDAFANASLEAAACGRAVISSTRNGAMEVVADGGIALADPNDVEAAATALDRLADPETRAALGQMGRQHALRHDWKRHVEQLQAFHRRVVAHRPSQNGRART